MSDLMVNVTIPTLNSERTLRSALESVRDQSHKDVHITIVDGFSRDRTVEIAREFTDDVVQYKGKVLGARIEGFRHRPGTHHILMDSDQVLERTVVERCLEVRDRYDMICLEERSYKPSTWLERLFDADRELLHKNVEDYIDAVTGVMCPRFYSSDILEKAFDNIPPECLPKIHAYEDAIIFYEASKISDRIGMVKEAAWHQEPRDLPELCKKNYKYGRDVRLMHKIGYYGELVGKKERFRRFDSRNIKGSIKANLLLVLKGVPYELGYYFGHDERTK
jgi:glycosyltransferase involved in cell wall biosynthesis